MRHIVAIISLWVFWMSATIAYAGDLTLPFNLPLIINSYFDHDNPNYTTNNLFIRYDGLQWNDGSASLQSCTLGVNCYDGHDAVDFETGTGDAIIASASGEVTFAGCSSSCNTGLGKYVKLWHSGHGYSTVYGHLDSIESTIYVGAPPVIRGQPLGRSGSTGDALGDHLHFAVRNAQTGGNVIDPYGWSGSGSDPWTYDQGYLWTTNPPTPPGTPPTVSSISPNWGINSGWVSISTISGTNFRMGSDVMTDLRANWRLDETSGAVIDYSGERNNGAIYGNPVSISGRLSNARRFDGIDDYVEVNDSTSLSPTGGLSISVWFKRNGINRIEYFFSKYNSYLNQISFHASFLTDNKLRFEVCATGACSAESERKTALTSTTYLQDGVWHHLVAVFDAPSSQLRIYVDNVDVSGSVTGTANSVFDSNVPVTLSTVLNRSETRDGYFTGDLDDARIYARALSTADIDQLYQSSATRGYVKLTKNGQTDIVCKPFSELNSTTLTNGSCNITGVTLGTWNVNVMNSDGTSGALSNGFTVSELTVTSINPPSGDNMGTVNISSVGGNGFRPGWDKESNLLGNWRMDETSGVTAYDVSGYNHNGAANTTAIVAGKLNNARYFDSTSDIINFGDYNDLDQASPATISFWWKGTPTSVYWLINKEEYGGLYRGYSVFFLDYSGMKLFWRIGQNDVGAKRTYCSTESNVPSDGLWHHYAITQVGGTGCLNNVSIYIDGASQDLIQFDSGSGNSLGSTEYLKAGDVSSAAVGTMDEFRIYNKALSAADVEALKNATGPGSVKLTRSGYSDLTCTGFTLSSLTALINGSCNLSGLVTGLWNVKVTNPAGENATLFNGFSVY